MSCHNDWIIFLKIPYLRDPFPSTTHHSLTVSVLHTHLHLRSFSEYNLHYLDHHGRRIAVLSMMDFQCRQNNGALTLKTLMSDSILTTWLVLRIYITSRNISSTRHHSTTPVTQKWCVDNENRDDIVNSFEISCHNVCSIFHKIPYLPHPFWIQLTIRLSSACCILTCI